MHTDFDLCASVFIGGLISRDGFVQIEQRSRNTGPRGQFHGIEILGHRRFAAGNQLLGRRFVGSEFLLVLLKKILKDRELLWIRIAGKRSLM